MTHKDMAARAIYIAASGILIHTLAAPVLAGDKALPIDPIIELAGADTGDKATPEQLKRADQQMVPSEDLKKAKPQSLPSAMQDKPAAPAKAAEDADKMPAKAAPAAETKPAAPKAAEQTKPAPEPAKPEKMAQADPTTGFYIRGDLGYGLTMDPDGSTSAGAMTNESVGNAFLIGGGVGYRFSDNIRTDVTFDFRADADVDATTAGGANVTSEVNAWTVMANAYWDVAKMNPLTPYLGAGLGYSRLETPTQLGGGGEGGASSDNLAWAAMLGVAIDLGVPEAAVDLGYRFISLGEFNQASGGASYEDLMAHEVRAGLRYRF